MSAGSLGVLILVAHRIEILPVRFHAAVEEVGVADADPIELRRFLELFLEIGLHIIADSLHSYARREEAYIVEFVRIHGGDVGRMAAAHGKAGYRSVSLVGVGAIVLFYIVDYVHEVGLVGERGIVDMVRLVVAPGALARSGARHDH